MTALRWSQVLAWRLQQHHLLERAERADLLAVVSRIGGLHAQVMSAAELALWARVRDLDPADVETALWDQRTLAKTWAMRGTLHLLPSAELPLYLAALNGSVAAFYRRGSWLKYHGVTLAELDALIAAVRETLGGTPITREQLADTVAGKTATPKLSELLRSGWGALLKPVAHAGYLCFGPSQGQNVTFVRPDAWLDGWYSPAPQAALQEVVRRFLAAYGPATVDDFGRWLGLELPKVKKLFATLGDELAPVEVEGWRAWALAATLEAMAAADAQDAVRLLPHFDPYVVALARQSDYLMPGADRTRVYRAQGWISPVVLVDGRIAGVWAQDKQRGRVAVRVELFAPDGPAVRRGIEVETARLGAFLGAAVELSIDPA